MKDWADEISKDEFLARCANAYPLLRDGARRQLLREWLDFVMRLEGGQLDIAVEFLLAEKRRTSGFDSRATLANDADGYALQEFAAILVHPCNVCATDPQAWWTRPAFCDHDRRTRGGDDVE